MSRFLYGAGLQKRARERTEEKEINPTARTGERCSASQYVNKFIIMLGKRCALRCIAKIKHVVDVKGLPRVRA